MPGPPLNSRDSSANNLLRRVGSNVRALRERRSLTQDYLAFTAGLATRHLQKIEAGQVNLTLRTMARLAKALNVDVELLAARALDPES
ncbi:helix-turn-helix domain-containing protein [Bradyrhizobium sp. HKCCYLRH1065]|uniref:helix-turn-helix domain-containing protein n=1 Tax=unclassified Bradyrhizobium TaxID=2631580 RepID=UPI003EBBBDA0